MKKKIIITAVLLAAFSAAATAEVYLWPVHGERRLSSSFGEYRSGHYHAGIDLRSFGSVGLPCLAVSDGWISRAKISPAGYGKALYVRLSDGRTAVYAHIDCFSGELDSILWYHRAGKGSAWCDIRFDEGRFPVSVGDTVCFSGNTGTTAPHLHFELRDEAERPINPLGIYSLPDRTPPIISGILAVPMEVEGSPVEALVEGAPFSREALLRAKGRELYTLADTFHVQGSVSFGVSVWDEQGYGRYPMAPMEIVLVIDGQTVYTIRNDSFSYTQSGEIVLEYDLRGKGPAGRYTLLFRKQGNTRSDRSGAGMVHSVKGLGKGLYLEKGYHRAEIAATDASGNISRAHFVFSTGLQPVISEARRLDAVSELVVGSGDPDGGPARGEVFGSLDGGKSWERIPLKPFGNLSTAEVNDTVPGLYRYRATDDEGAWAESWIGTGPVRYDADMAFFDLDLRESDGGLVLDAESDASIAGDPVLRVLDRGRPDTLKIYRTGVSTFSARVEGRPPDRGLTVFHLSGRDFRGYPAEAVLAAKIMSLGSGSGAAVTVGDSVEAVLESPSVRGTLACATLDVAWPGPPPEGLTSKSSPFRIIFSAPKLKRGLRLRTETDRRTGLFMWDEEKGWQCVGVPAMEDGSAGIEEPGVYCLFSDGIPPVIAHAALEEGHGNSSFFRKIYCVLPVTEEGSGIDPFSARATLNGTGVVVEWDAPRDRLVIPLPGSIPSGMVRLEVEVSDRSGNRTVGEYGFMLQ